MVILKVRLAALCFFILFALPSVHGQSAYDNDFFTEGFSAYNVLDGWTFDYPSGTLKLAIGGGTRNRFGTVPLSEWVGQDFVASSWFTVKRIEGSGTSPISLGIVALGDAGVPSNYYLAYWAVAGGSGTGELVILRAGGGSFSITGEAIGLPDLDQIYELRLTGNYVINGLRLTVRVFDQDGVPIGSATEAVDPSPLTGPHFGIRNRTAHASQFLEIDHYRYKVSQIPAKELPVLKIGREGDQILLNWTGGGVQLTSAPDVRGPWSIVEGATSPFPVNPGPVPRQFFRLRRSVDEMPWGISGTGGAHFLVEAGTFEVEVFKRDLNFRGSRGSHMTAYLIGPDREVVDTAVIPSSGGSEGDPPGPVRSALLSVRVDRPGMYALMITTQGDHHGNYIEWAFETNAKAWVVETARGHRDERHREPIVMSDPKRTAGIHFLPPPGKFNIEIEGLPEGAEALTLYDDTGTEFARIPVVAQRSTSIREYMGMHGFAKENEASARFTVAANPQRGNRPWRLHVPQAQFYLEIDSLTRWQSADIYPDQNVWTPVGDSWFPFLEHRWLISPYQRTVYAMPGEPGQATFMVHNNSPHERTMDLNLEFPGNPWAAELSTHNVTLGPKSNAEVVVHFDPPANSGEQICHIRVTPRQAPEVTTYATLKVRGGHSPVGEPLNLPLALDPFSHENRQFGYLPKYPVGNQVYFDLENRGFVGDGPFLHRQVGDDWVKTDLREAVTVTVPEVATSDWTIVESKVAFDANNYVYVIGQSGEHVALLRSKDRGETFTAYLMEGRENERRWWDIEQFSGHNVPDGPPAVVRLIRTEEHSPDGPRWRRVNDVDLFVAEETFDGHLLFHPPVRLTDKGLSVAMHSGIPSMVVSRGSKIHVTWGEATDPEVSLEEIPGVPAYVATYDRQTRMLSEPVFMSFGAPPNDGHNTPSITLDSYGYLHVVVGAHARPFQYLRSLAPNDAESGWTDAIRTSEKNIQQTYVGLVCDDEDNLHLVFRVWEPAGAEGYGAAWTSLIYQRKRPRGNWEEPRLLVVPPFSEYSIYYHRLTLDRNGKLFLNYDYWSTMWFYRNEGRGPVAAASGRPGDGWGRAVVTSPDGGGTWMLW